RFGRLMLSRKAVEPDPWDAHGEELKRGTVHKGKVSGLTEYGAFVELVPGVDGLLHISEIGRDLKHASQVLSEGEVVSVLIEQIDRKQRRISLSKPSPEEAKEIEEGKVDLSARPPSLRPGVHATVQVQKADHQGLAIQVVGVLGKRGRGFIAR